PLVEDMTEDRLLEVLEEALSARIIEEMPQAIARYQFTHALIQETLAGELTMTRKVRLHAQIAEALEVLYGGDSEAHAAELAHHFAEAEAVLGPDKLVRYSLLAGEKALASYAWEEAQNHFARGLAARSISIAESDPLLDAEAAALTFGLGRARVATADQGQMQEAVNSLARVFDYYFETGDKANALAVAEFPVPMANRRTGMTQILGKALTLVSPGSLPEGRLLSHYGWELARVEGDYAAAQAAFNRALAIARDAGDANLELSTLTRSADVDLFQLRLAESSTKSLESIELAVRAGDTYEEASARLTASRALILRGEGVEAQTQASALLALGERVGNRHWLGMGTALALHQNSQLACLKGDWSQGRDLAEEALALAPQDPLVLSRLAILEYETGNFSQGEAYLERLLKIMALAPPSPRAAYFYPAMAIPYAARVSGVSFRLSEAAEAAQIILSAPSVTPLYTVVARCGLGLQAIIQGDAPAAAEQYVDLEIVQGILLPRDIAGDRVLALLSQTIGELDQAAVHFEDSLRFCIKAGYRPELAWSCCDYADTLLQRNNPGDREKAMSLLDESLATSTELGMRPLMERVLSRREILKA
ncbi:MAG: tetratricopeptide repeat protein, partial [Dehalococcoidia bacterium]